MRTLAFIIALILVTPLFLALAGCAEKQEKPPASAGYYDGPMTPAGGNAKAKGKKGGTE